MFKKFLSCLLSLTLMLSFFMTVPVAAETPSADRFVPTEKQETELVPLENENILRGSAGEITAYAWNIYDNAAGVGEGPVTVNIPSGSLQSISHDSTLWMAAGDFVGDTWYAISNPDSTPAGLYTINKDTGTYTLIGYPSITYPIGFTYDAVNEVAYVCDDTSNLYTIDLTTAQTTLVGPIGSSYVIGIAANSAGDLYGIELQSDNLISIDKSTGSGTVVGSTGINLNYAQDICFDRNNDILYGTLYDSSSSSGGLYSIDTTTGAATLLYSFKAEIDGFAIPYQANPGPVIDESSLKVIGITDNAATLIWDKATDDVTPQDQLTYQVYYSTDPMTDLTSIESSTAFGSETADVACSVITGLAADTSYNFGVVVKDGDNNKSFMFTEAATAEALPWTYVGHAAISDGTANYTSMLVNNGIPYVAFMDGGNDNKATLLKYENGWQAVGVAGFTPGYADSESLYITADGTPYVAFRDGNQSYRASLMKYSEASGWIYVGNPGFSGEMAGDITVIVEDGIPYVACRDNSTLSRPTVKQYDAGSDSWLTLGNPSGLSVNSASSLCLVGINGVPYIAFSELGPSNCKVNVQSYDSGTNTWHAVGTGLDSSFGMYLTMNLYQNGAGLDPMIAYADLNHGSRTTVMLYNPGTNTWSTLGEPGFSPINEAYDLSMVSSNNDIYLAYTGMYDRSATVMLWDGSRWVSKGVASFTAGNAEDISLTYDGASDIPYLSFRDDANGAGLSVMKYSLDYTAPEVLNIVRQNPQNSSTRLSMVTFRATFSEAVSGVDISDFSLARTGSVHGTISEVTAIDELNYDVKVIHVSGNGTLKLNLNDSNTEIVDVSGNPIAAGYSNGQSYHIRRVSGGGGGGGSTPSVNPTTGTAAGEPQTEESVTGNNEVNFADVKPDAWYKKAVDFIAARGITSGISGNLFGPDNSLTRGQFIVLLMNAYQIKPLTGTLDAGSNFSDAGNTYYTGYLAAAKQAGITKGIGNNLFAPERNITRQEMFVLLYNVLKTIGKLPAPVSDTQLSSFKDADQVADWAREAMTAMLQAGVIGGSNNMLNPNAITTRAEMAQVLYNLLAK